MPRFIIPTRNRPSSMNALLSYLCTYFPGTALIVADGSQEKQKEKTQIVCEKYSKTLNIDYKPYPEDLPLFERMLDVLHNCEDECFAIGADDDFPIVDVYEEAEMLLLSDPRYSNIVPADVVLRLKANGTLISRLSHSRQLIQSNPVSRVKDFATWHFATSYGVCRRELLIERYTTMAKFYCASFIDFQIGLEDALKGRIRALPKIGCIRTQTYEHNYLRATKSLIFLRQSKRILKYRDYLTSRLKEVGDLSESGSQQIADKLISNRIADLVNAGAEKTHNFKNKKQFTDNILQLQYKLYYELFQEGTEIRDQHLDKLRYATDVLYSDVAKSENVDGARNYETLE